MSMPRVLTATVALSMLLAACSPAAAPSTTITSTTTTVPPTPTSTTTTTLPPPSVTVMIDGGPAGLTDAVTALYREAHDRRGDLADLPEGLAALVETLERDDRPTKIRGQASIATLGSDATPVAVVTANEDVLLAIADPDWRIVGAKLTRFGLPAWYGEEPLFLLVIGTDARPGHIAIRARADSIHIVSMVPSSATGSIVGFPRDSLVTAPDGLVDKFTHILARRDIDTFAATARDLTSLPVQVWDLTAFQGFVQLVDAFGGFDIDVPQEMADKNSKAYFETGPQHFDGTDALAFSRNRHLPGGDLTRSYDQGLVMLAGLRAVQARGISELPRLLGFLTTFTDTSMTPEQLLQMGAAAYELDPETLPNVVAPGTFGTYKGSSIIELSDEAYDIFADLADGVLDQTN